MEQDEDRQLAHACEELVKKYADKLSAEEVAERFSAITARFERAPIRTFVPVLVASRTRNELEALVR